MSTDEYFKIKPELFWTIIFMLLSACFCFGYHFGNTKFDTKKIELSDENNKLILEVKSCKEIISRMNQVSDSAWNILGNMPYKEMNLDSIEFKKVQTTLEKAGFALEMNSKLTRK
ncbi:MAG: hypothetical protein IPG95_13530 [Saprospiraceae bacterium]|nr:hypothetical protein [Saprospiraceae bacterium]